MATPAHDGGQELRLLRLLSSRYPTITAAHSEMINLRAIMALPKGTDHYISDIHGAAEQFDQILRHASGAVKRKITQTFGAELPESEQTALAMLIYYPELELQRALAQTSEPKVWLATMVARLARVARTSSEKYTRSKVRKRLAPQRAYILEELLTESQLDNAQKEHYYQGIVRSIVDLHEGEHFIVTLAELIRSLVVDRLYIVGDIYDRGQGAEKVLDRLMAHHYVSIQWGNHDVSWMGAASGCPALVANVVRMALRYITLETLCNSYGINLRGLARFAEAVYGDDPCVRFTPKAGPPVEGFSLELLGRMHKAITMIQQKLEAQAIRRHPEYEMQARLLLDAIDMQHGTLTIDGVAYPMVDANWPTLAADDRAALTPAEAEVIEGLCAQFQRSERLHEHIRFLYAYGGMFQVQDGNLKFHGYLPVDEQGEFITFALGGELLAGPPLLRRYEQMAREAFFSRDEVAKLAGQDAMWYLWCGQHSPLCGRERLTTFERYVVDDPATHEEPKGPYYALRDNEAFCRRMLVAFGGDPEHGHIINGHTPVKVKKGERPLLASGRMIIIDGGMSEAYQSVTGIAGYTLIGNSHELLLAAYEPFSAAEVLVREGSDPTPHTERVQTYPQRVLIADTDIGRELRGQLDDLEKLVAAYRHGVLVEGAPSAYKLV